MEHDPTTTMLLKLPLSLKEAVTLYAVDNNMSVSHAIRLSITRELSLPDHAADMSGPRTTQTPPINTNTPRRRKARRIQRQLATLAPEVITYLLEQESPKE